MNKIIVCSASHLLPPLLQRFCDLRVFPVRDRKDGAVGQSKFEAADGLDKQWIYNETCMDPQEDGSILFLQFGKRIDGVKGSVQSVNHGVRGAGSGLDIENGVRNEKVADMILPIDRDALSGDRTDRHGNLHLIVVDRVDLIALIVRKRVGDMDDGNLRDHNGFSVGSGHLFIPPGIVKSLVMDRHRSARIVRVYKICQNDLAGMRAAGNGGG